MSELSLLSRRRVLALAAFLMAGSPGAWSKDGDSGGHSGGGGSDHGEGGEGGSSGHGGGDHDSGDGRGRGRGRGRGGDDGDGRGRGRGRGRGNDDDDRDDDDLSDQEYARRGVERGEMVPLSSVLRTVRAARPGRVVNVDLVRTTRRGAIYRVVVMGSEHDLWQISVDAERNRILGMRRY